MSIQRSYTQTIARELRRYAVWQPGEALTLGDYGTLNGATFYRLGHISEFVEPSLMDIRTSSTSTLEFTSEGTRVAMLAGEGDASAIRAQATLKIGFARRDAIYLRASGIQTRDVANVRSVSETLRAHPQWKFEWAVLSNLTSATKASIILSMGANTEVSVLAEARALQEFNLGRAKVSSGLTFVGEAAFRIVGVAGPLLFDLIRLRRLLGGTRRAAVPGNVSLLPYEQVLPDQH
jgi:hypothetical protein